MPSIIVGTLIGENYSPGGGSGGAVDSVNGQTGVVVLDLDDIVDVSVGGALDGYVLSFNASASQWVAVPVNATSILAEDVVVSNGAFTVLSGTDAQTLFNDIDDLFLGVPDTLDELSDVVITAASNTQFLRYNGADWVNATVDFSVYLTAASAALEYQPIGDYVTSAEVSVLLNPYLTSASAVTEYQTKASSANFITAASVTTLLTPYITSASAFAAFITPGSVATLLTPYLTSASAAAAYQPIGDYVTSAQVSVLLNPYLTSASASVTYAPKLLSIFSVNSAHEIALVNLTGYIRVCAATTTTVQVPTSASVAIPYGAQVVIRAAASGQVVVAGNGGVVVNTSETLKLRKKGSTASLIKINADEWDLTGDLEEL